MKESFRSAILFLVLLSASRSYAEPLPKCCLQAEEPGRSATAGFTDQSLYQSDTVWTNDAYQLIKLGSLNGRPQIVTLFFANCTYACPLVVQQMKLIEEQLPAALRGNVDFLLISMDSERDTPGELKKYRAEHHLSSHWNILAGDSDNVLELAALLGVKFKKDARGGFVHSNLLTLLNGRGEIVFQQTGLRQGANEFIQHLNGLASK
jgi:protein SCO1/2